MEGTDQVLTQEEIDAMLSGSAPAPAPVEAAQAPPPEPEPPPPPVAAVPPPVSAQPPGPIPGSPPGPSGGSDRLDNLEQSISGIDGTVRQLQQVVQDLTAQLQLVSKNLEGTIGMAARDSFSCSSCQTTGQVAAKLTCTSCGADNWWGWYPPQEPGSQQGN